jgi:N-methylhydantoinase B
MSNATNLPIEYAESVADFFRVVNYELIANSGGDGRFRGGLAQRRTYEILADDVFFGAYTDRFQVAPWGLFGGENGRVGSFTVLRSDERIDLPPLVSNFRLRRGDVLVTEMAGGGGYGDPSTRSAADRERDRIEGRVTT